MHADAPSQDPGQSTSSSVSLDATVNAVTVEVATGTDLAPSARPTDGDSVHHRRASRMFWRARRSALSWVGVGILLVLLVVGLFGPQLAPYPQDAGPVVQFQSQLKPPSLAHPMGTDDAGRDVLSRVLIGARISLLTGIVVVAVAMAIGVTVGLIAGYFGGIISVIIMRVADVFLAIPGIALALAITAALRPSLMTMMLAISLVWWPWFARLVQAEVLTVKNEAFVDASRTYGASNFHIILHDILPNVTSVIVVKATLDIGFAILIAAALGFLGVGVQPPTPEWGSMIATGRQYLPTVWWLSTFPGLAIFLAVIGFNLLGDALRDILDVRYEG